MSEPIVIRSRGPYPYRRERRVHEICRYLRQEKNLDAQCEGCPASEFMPEAACMVTRGCRVGAEEVYNIARHGNPWGWWLRIWLIQTIYKLQRKYRWIPRRKEKRP
jgi:hypothetical protein